MANIKEVLHEKSTCLHDYESRISDLLSEKTRTNQEVNSFREQLDSLQSSFMETKDHLQEARSQVSSYFIDYRLRIRDDISSI